jgi:hypothetical protein
VIFPVKEPVKRFISDLPLSFDVGAAVSRIQALSIADVGARPEVPRWSSNRKSGKMFHRYDLLRVLQWTTAGSGARFALRIHHTDADLR